MANEAENALLSTFPAYAVKVGCEKWCVQRLYSSRGEAQCRKAMKTLRQETIQ